jgi:hypothetical protein
MPSRLVYGYQDFWFRFRHSPAAIAATAGAIGVICGALVIGVLHKPSTNVVDVAQNQPVETVGAGAPVKADPPQIKAETPPVAASTDKTAPLPADSAGNENKEASASAYCEQQTWPYITQDCLTETTGGQRKVRVITTDKIAAPVVSAIEAPRANELSGASAKPEQNTVMQQQPVAVRSAPATPAATAPAAAVEAKAIPARTLQEQPAGQAAAAAPANAAPAAAPEPQRASTKEARSKNARDKRKREAKSRRAPPLDDDDDEDANSRVTAFAGRDVSPTRNRIVERWTEREYDVPSYDGSHQRRRVIVIRRSNNHTSVYMPGPGNPRSVFQH